jgi:O-antigen/teichoic acid export membrane protein
MSLQRSVIATAGSRAYLLVIGLLALPVYRSLLGPDAYGLVAIYVALQLWLQLLDLGLPATLAREAALTAAGAQAATSLRALTSTFERWFGALVVLACLAAAAIAPWGARHWLTLGSVPAADAASSLALMTACVLLRLHADLYRGVLSGFERQRWLAAVNAVFGTVKVLGVLPFLMYTGASPVRFFVFQLCAHAVELVVVRAQAWRLLPRSPVNQVPPQRSPWRLVLQFSLSMSLASTVWVLASQVDKLLLSGLLPLRDYGAYGLAVTAASGVLLAAGALADTLVPRLTALQSTAGAAEVQALYRAFTQWGAVMACAAAGVLAFHAEGVLLVWTGDAALAAEMAPVLAVYALGNAALALASFPYYLQLASGRLRMHLLGTALMFALLLPGVLWATPRFGPLGAASAWLAVNLLYLLVWTAIVHAKFAPGLHARWWAADILPIAVLGFGAAALTRQLHWPAGRLAQAALLLAVSAVILAACAAGSSKARGSAWAALKRQTR